MGTHNKHKGAIMNHSADIHFARAVAPEFIEYGAPALAQHSQSYARKVITIWHALNYSLRVQLHNIPEALY